MSQPEEGVINHEEEDIRPYASMDDVKDLVFSLYGMKVND